jgi:protein SCO1
MRLLKICGLWVACGWLAPGLQAQPLSDQALAQIRFEQHLDAQVPATLPFRDEDARPVRLGQYFVQKPVLLILGYYRCPMLCSLELNGLIGALQDVRWSAGQQFEVLVVSIDPHETPALAAAKKRTYLVRYGRPGAASGWHFLTGQPPAIQRLARAVGFRYAYDPVSNQFAHPSGVVLLTPQGKIARYFFGLNYHPAELAAGLQQAAASRVASPARQLFFLCFRYNPLTGRYSLTIMGLLRLMSVGTVLGLAGLCLTLGWRHRMAAEARPAAGAPAAQLAPRKPNISLPLSGS